jgi:long-chain fatty acid transport protein
MTRLPESQMVVGTQALFPEIKFDTDESSFGGGNGGNAGYFTPSAFIGYVHSVTPDFKLGVSAGSYFGLGLDYDDDWAGRYYLQEGAFLTFGVNPVAAYRINKYLSVGAGVSMVAAEYGGETALRNLEPGASDGRLKFDAYDIGWGGNAGFLIELSESTRFGVSYRSKVDLTYKDKPELHNHRAVASGRAECLRAGRCESQTRHGTAAGGAGQGLSRDNRQAGRHGESRLAGLERFRQYRCVHRQHHLDERLRGTGL